jgi:hypothetical protein
MGFCEFIRRMDSLGMGTLLAFIGLCGSGDCFVWGEDSVSFGVVGGGVSNWYGLFGFLVFDFMSRFLVD